MSKFKIFGMGAAYGLLMRLMFGMPLFSQPKSLAASGPMLAAFVVLVPLLIGMYTVHAARANKPTLGFAVMAPWVPTLVFVAGTALLLIEGSICIAMAVPIFCIMASVGGMIGLLLIKTPWPMARPFMRSCCCLCWPAMQSPASICRRQPSKAWHPPTSPPGQR